ncbi:RNA polymerase Rpb5 domain-containing protein [Catenaria anguillulae PL171]|uniref:DNA-directed RNA polymerases I, II, and III subunit RPABC1 n=1 Tax=Catenaria anguillulae PL171 TaxID=765915 RepID=A0A1Y2I0B0_9FUNG|nr:RNA polymerase Rpb5 domain-containing protein [Catenaria anguillulae PL171]
MSTDAQTREVSRMYRIHKTIYEMMADRGYMVPEEQTNLTLEDFKSRYAPNNQLQRDAAMNLMFAKPGVGAETEPIMIAFIADDSKNKIGVAHIKQFCELLVASNIPRGIIVHKQPLGPQAKGIVNSSSDKYRLEAFEEAELVVNITKHTLVPKHEKLEPEEKKTLLERYRLKETQLPRIPSSDPVARYLGLRRGEVVKIIRNSETAGKYVTYRLCF